MTDIERRGRTLEELYLNSPEEIEKEEEKLHTVSQYADAMAAKMRMSNEKVRDVA